MRAGRWRMRGLEDDLPGTTETGGRRNVRLAQAASDGARAAAAARRARRSLGHESEAAGTTLGRGLWSDMEE